MSAVSRLASEITRETGRSESRGGFGRTSNASAGFRGALEDGMRSANTTATPPLKTEASAPDVGAQSVESVRKACTDSGMSIAGCNFSYNDELVWSPWGGYRNPQVQVTDANGRHYTFNAELSLKNPQITARELHEMMNTPVKPAVDDSYQSESRPPGSLGKNVGVEAPAPDLGLACVDAVRKACAESGVNTESLQFNYNDQPVSTPWGGYRNPQVQITLPDGRLFTFSAELAFRNPQLTAFELRQMQSTPSTRQV